MRRWFQSSIATSTTHTVPPSNLRSLLPPQLGFKALKKQRQAFALGRHQPLTNVRQRADAANPAAHLVEKEWQRKLEGTRLRGSQPADPSPRLCGADGVWCGRARAAMGKANNRATKSNNSISHVQVLGWGTDTLQGCLPSMQLFFDNHRLLFNVGEGLQRLCTDNHVRPRPALGATSGERAANRTNRGFGWETGAHAPVSPRPPNHSNSTVSSTEGYTYTAQLWALCLVEGHFQSARAKYVIAPTNQIRRGGRWLSRRAWVRVDGAGEAHSHRTHLPDASHP